MLKKNTKIVETNRIISENLKELARWTNYANDQAFWFDEEGRRRREAYLCCA